MATPGDQKDPSIDGRHVVYAGPGADGAGIDVLLYDLESRATRVVGGGPGDQQSPDVSTSGVVYLEPDGVAVAPWQGPLARVPARDGPVSAPTIGSGVVAWESGPVGARDIRVMTLDPAGEYTLQSPRGGAPVGDQLAPAAFGSLVAFVDDGDAADRGSVWLHDAAAGTFAKICAGRASGVSVAHDDGSGVVVAVARAPLGGDDDVEVYDASGTLLAALAVPGVQRNPHVAGEWVAFEDDSTEYSQVVLWNWRTGLVFVPRPTKTEQVLNDLAVVATEIRVVFEDTNSPASGRDIALYVLDVDPIVFDDEPNGYPFEPGPEDPPGEPVGPATCDGDDADARLLAVLELGRDRGKPQAGEVAFAATLPAGARHLPVLVCVDADRVSSAWITLDDEALATPADFEPHVIRLERFAGVAEAGRLSGVIAGKPGAWLTARVLADPARAAPAAPAGSGSIPRASRFLSGGCGTAGLGGAGSLAALLILAAGLARRRS